MGNKIATREAYGKTLVELVENKDIVVLDADLAGATKTAMFKKIAAIIDCSEQTVKGNYYSLNESSEIDKSRYTAHLHKEKVKTDYNSLK